MNSVVQALYFCRPFRNEVLAYQKTSDEPDTLLSVLAELFDQIATSRRKFGILHPKKFVTKVKKENGKSLAELNISFMVALPLQFCLTICSSRMPMSF